ncbi:hypothetical protein, conserved [Leishmania lindenbergi]|uniref:Kinetoplast-associated protein-like protein n=1 Tax=Leishmania lindenbergi TaxID=651832 RepID=A0AAW3ATT1_9TRYP
MDFGRRQRPDEVMAPKVEASLTLLGVSAPSSSPSAAHCRVTFDTADQQAACTTDSPPRASVEEKARAGTLAVVSPSSSRFQVPPPPLSQTARAPAAQASRHASPHKGKESATVTSTEAQSPNSVHAYHHGDRQLSEDAVKVVSVRSDAEGEEGDVAARVLSSLIEKDNVIKRLTRTVEALQDENTVLHSRRAAAAAEAAVVPTPPATGFALSPDRVKTSSPSWPATPVRWWKTEHKASLSEGVRQSYEGSQAPEGSDHANLKKQRLHASPSLSAAHATTSTITTLQRTLAEKEAELAGLHAHIATTRGTAQAAGDAAVFAGEPPLGHNTGDSLTADVRRAPSAATSAAEAVAEARIAQLEWQLENVQQEKREDTHTLRDHINHLTRELHRKSRDMARQERQHKLELTALQQEVTALADQLEEQIRVSASAASAAPRREPETEQVMELQRQLAEVKAREALLLRESAATQRRWLRELEEQKHLLDEARAEAAQEEAQNECRVQQERQLAQMTAQQQQQQLEAQVRQYKAALAQAQRELSELRTVHQRTEATVSDQRQHLQLISHDIATAALERAHEEQRTARAEEQVMLLRQQLRQAEAIISSQKAELEALRQARQDEATTASALQEEEHAALLKHVEGCMKGSEAVESALLAAESSRREMASQLAHALDERNEYHRLFREASVQAQAQLLEQQQLLSEGNDVVFRRLREVQADLTCRTEALGATQSELQTVQRQIFALKDELSSSETARCELGEELRAVQARYEAQTAQLVRVKEDLKGALQAQLTTVGKLRRREQQLRSQQAMSQRARERRQEEQRALQGIVDLLWSPAASLLPACRRASAMGTHEVSRVLSLPPAKVLRSAATLAPGSIPALSRRALAMLEWSASIDASKSRRDQKRRWAGRAVALAAGVDAKNSDVQSTVHPSRSASSVSSATTSVVMSAVSWADAPATCEEDDTSAKLRAAGSARVPLHSRVDSNLPTLERQLQLSAIAHNGEGRTAATDTDLPVLRLLGAIHDAVEQMCAAYTAAQHELGTKRTAVRTLVKERKAQQAQVEELRATLQEQQHKAERLQRNAVQTMRAESQVELEKANHAWRERHEVDMALQLRSCAEQHRRAVAEVVEACAEHVQAELIAFVQLLPTTLGAALAAAASASAESMRDKVLREVRHEYCCPPDTPTAVHHLVGGHDHGAPTPPTSTAAAAADDVSLLSLGLEVQPDVQAECDAIIRDVLGMACGWDDLTSAVMIASSTAVATYPPGRVPPSTASPDPQPGALAYNSAVGSSASPPAAEPTQRIVANAEAALWAEEEMAELREVIHSHLTHSLASLTAVTSLSSLAGVTTGVSGNGKGEVRQDAYGHVRDTPATLGGASSGTSPINAKRADAGEGLEAALRETVLPRWMNFPRTATHQASPAPPRSSAAGVVAATPVSLHQQQPRLLALLLNACVAHVHERLLA